MNCHEFRLQSVMLSRETQSPRWEPALERHRKSCEACHRWASREEQLENLISSWKSELPEIHLEEKVLHAWKSETLPRLATRNTPANSPFLAPTRRLVVLVSTLAATLLLAIPQLALQRSLLPFSDELAGWASPEAAPVEEIFTSVQTVVDRLASVNPPQISMATSTPLLPEWKLGLIELSGDSANPTQSEWKEFPSELEPLRSEVRDAMGFIWSAVPDEES